MLRSYVGEQLAPTRGPIVIATDYVRAVPEQIRAFLPPGRRCVTLGTDGFGRSDTRAALRAHFEVDAAAISPGGIALARLSERSIDARRQRATSGGTEGLRSVAGRVRGYDRFASHPFRRKPWIRPL